MKILKRLSLILVVVLIVVSIVGGVYLNFVGHRLHLDTQNIDQRIQKHLPKTHQIAGLVNLEVTSVTSSVVAQTPLKLQLTFDVRAVPSMSMLNNVGLPGQLTLSFIPFYDIEQGKIYARALQLEKLSLPLMPESTLRKIEASISQWLAAYSVDVPLYELKDATWSQWLGKHLLRGLELEPSGLTVILGTW